MKGNITTPKSTLLAVGGILLVAVVALIVAIVMKFAGVDSEKGAATGKSALEAFKDVAGESYVDELADLRKMPDGEDPVVYLAENSAFVMDDEAVEIYIQGYVTAAESSAQAKGISVEKLLIDEWGFESVDAYRKEAEKTSMKFIKEHLAVFEYAMRKNVKIVEKEYEEQLSSYALKFGYATAEEFVYDCTPASIANEMLYDKTVDMLN